MCENNSSKIIEEINKLSNEEATELLNRYTNVELMTLINHHEVLDEHMKMLSENMMKMARIMSGLYRVASKIRGISDIEAERDTFADMDRLTDLITEHYEVWDYTCSLNDESKAKRELTGAH